jgi:transposase
MFVHHNQDSPFPKTEMQLKTILNSVTDYKSFVFGKIYFEKTDGVDKTVVINIEPRKNSRPICSACHKPCPQYDTMPEARWFEFVPLWNIVVYFVYRMRRVTCPEHGVIVEGVPWGDGKCTQTIEHRQFLANWARSLSWSETAAKFKTTYGKVFRAVQWIVVWGLLFRDLDDVRTLGVDEIQYRKGHCYVTLVYQLDDDNRRLLGIEKDRDASSLQRFFKKFNEGTEGEGVTLRSSLIEFVCSDMLKAYLNAIESNCPNALNILDRFHVKGHLTKAVDDTRKLDVAKLKDEGYESVLSKSKYIFLKNPENLTEKQAVKLEELLGYNLRVIRAYLMKEDFERFWEYKSPYWAGRFLDEWCVRAMRSKIEPVKKFVRTLRNHRELLLNWFKSKGLSNGAVEGFNNKVKLTTRKGYGFRTFEALETALFHALGKLPEPKATHRFW